MESISPETREKLEKLESLQSSLDSTVLQKQRIDEELAETEKAIEALKDNPTDGVYRFLGKILIKKDREKTLLELQEGLDLLKLRSSALEKQQERLKEKIQELGDSVRGSLSGQ